MMSPGFTCATGAAGPYTYFTSLMVVMDLKFDHDPFAVSMNEKLDLTHSAAASIKKDPKVFSAFSALGFESEDKYFASSEGSSIQQYIVRSYPMLQATAVDTKNGISRDRAYSVEPQTAGWEAIAKANLLENAPRIRSEVLEHLAAPPVSPGKKDLVTPPKPSLAHHPRIHWPPHRTRPCPRL